MSAHVENSLLNLKQRVIGARLLLEKNQTEVICNGVGDFTFKPSNHDRAMLLLFSDPINIHHSTTDDKAAKQT